MKIEGVKNRKGRRGIYLTVNKLQKQIQKRTEKENKFIS